MAMSVSGTVTFALISQVYGDDGQFAAACPDARNKAEAFMGGSPSVISLWGCGCSNMEGISIRIHSLSLFD